MTQYYLGIFPDDVNERHLKKVLRRIIGSLCEYDVTFEGNVLNDEIEYIANVEVKHNKCKAYRRSVTQMEGKIYETLESDI